MNLNKIHNVYLIGIGGIGMSAIALYFLQRGKRVAGYDKTPTTITKNLQNKGVFVHFEESVDSLPDNFILDKEDTLVIFTPAIPNDHKGLQFLLQNNYNLYKRAEVLGLICLGYKTIAVAGTHGKTSISTIATHLFNGSEISSFAFLGGISKNYESNLVLSRADDDKTIAIVEADEFDRSFLQLKPHIALISSIDEDHLDIYENKSNLEMAFNQFINQIDKKGILVYKKGLNLQPEMMPSNVYTYSLTEKASFHAQNLKVNSKKQYCFDFHTPFFTIKNFTVGIPGRLNAENSIAALALAVLNGVDNDLMRCNLLTFAGVKRRFDYQINTEKMIYIDDYAHHPEEIKAFLSSVKEIYPEKRISGIFQPHLYSRTKDFAKEFAESLNVLDEVILLDIYPAREKAIERVSSKLIFDHINIRNKKMCSLSDLTNVLKNKEFEVLLTMGAGNIDTKINEIKEMFSC